MRTLKTKPVLAGLAIVSANWICKAHDMVPAPPQDHPLLLGGGTVHTVSGSEITNGQILFDGGKIVEIGNAIEPPAECEIIDVSGKHIYPGLISSLSRVGLVEISAVRATIDTGELETINSNLRAEVAVNPDSEIIPVTRANGVLTAHVTPLSRSSGLISGQTAVMNLEGWTTDDMRLKSPVGMKIRWPNDPGLGRFVVDPSSERNPAKAEENYADKIQELEKAFADARAFWKAKENGKAGTDVDLRWEALGPVIKQEIPLHVLANSVRQIRDSIHWAAREKLNMVLLGGAEAWRLPDLLKEHGIPVIIGNINTRPRHRWESYDQAFKNPLLLYEAGVKFAIGYNSGAPNEGNERNLPFEAGKAVAHGLSKEEALKAITLYPAEILGVAERLGSLEAGKDATLIVTTGNPMDIRTQVEMAFIQGRPVDLSSRHTQLYEKYQQRYRQE